MYVNRPDHEAALRRGIRTGYNIVVHGDSGCGKSWLYKKVFKDEGVFFKVVDFSTAGDADEVDILLLEAVTEYMQWVESSKTNERDIEFKPANMGGKYKEQTVFAKLEASPFARLLSAIRHQAGKSKKSFLVFENLEYILDKEDVVKKIQTMLLALDDPNSAKFDVKICLVGVPSEIKEVLSDGNKYQTISNRVYEVPEVDRLSRTAVNLLVVRGLEQELEYTIESKTYCYSKIAFVTYRIPQYVHDVCLHVAMRAEETLNQVNPEVIDLALRDWIMSNSRQSIEFVRRWIMGDRAPNRTRAKIIYTISRLEEHFFSAEDITEELKKQFPKSMSGKRVQTLAALRKMSEGEERILKCDADRRLFRVATPQIRSSLRICLNVDKTEETVSIKSFDNPHDMPPLHNRCPAHRHSRYRRPS